MRKSISTSVRLKLVAVRSSSSITHVCVTMSTIFPSTSVVTNFMTVNSTWASGLLVLKPAPSSVTVNDTAGELSLITAPLPGERPEISGSSASTMAVSLPTSSSPES